LLQLGQQFGCQSQIAVASKRDLFVLAAQLFIDRLEPDELALLRRREALVTVSLGDQALDRSRKRGALARRVERLAWLHSHNTRPPRRGARPLRRILGGANPARAAQCRSDL
jgi:hypothetical protein